MKPLFRILIASLLLVSCKDDEKPYDASGVFEATEVIVSAKAAGELLELDVDEGQAVERGSRVGRIDAALLDLQKQQLAADIDANNSRRLDAARQVASLRQQIVNLQAERKRFAELVAKNAATQKQVDDIDHQIEVVRRQVAAGEEQIVSSNRSLDGTSRSLRSRIEQLDDRAADAIITSPIAGTVLEKYAERGEYAQPGRALFKVADLADMKLRAYISADQLTCLKLGQRVSVYADRGKDGRKRYEGRVVWISDQAEFTPKTIQTRDERANLVYAVKIAVRNDGLIKRGMYGDVRFSGK